MAHIPDDWTPVEARQYLDDHRDGSGDPEMLEECRILLNPKSGPAVNPASTTQDSPFTTEPEEPMEEKGAD